MKVTKYNRGEMYWYINPDVKKENYCVDGENQDFLDDRPILIISEYTNEFNDSVIVIPTTTSPHKNGIPIDMYTDKGIEKTQLIPYKTRWIPVKYLKKYIGRLDDSTLNMVYESLDYHHGRSNKVPDYVEKDRKFFMELAKRESDKKSIITQTHDKKHSETSNNKKKKEITSNKNKIEETKPVETKTSKQNSFSRWTNINIIKTRNHIKNIVDPNSIKTYADLLRVLYNLNPTKKANKKSYEKLYDYKEKYRIMIANSKAAAKKHSLNVNQMMAIKSLCVTDFAISQLILLNKLRRHDISISDFDEKDKIMFLTLETSELEKYIKKGSVVINNYKSRFEKEIGIL